MAGVNFKSTNADSDIEENLVDTGPGCVHYKRRCAFISPCCGKRFACRLCHNDVEMHELDRYAVIEIQCIECETKQQVSNECVKCGTTFGKYYCNICRLYDDNDKQQFHCDPCGLCRVGGRDNFFHCEKCNMCLSQSLRNKHKCVENVTHANCAVCMEDLHTSVKPTHVPKCGHVLHRLYTCPTCNESYENMKTYWEALDVEIANTPMPDEYRDKKMNILCRDCHKHSETLFHIFGMKCQECGSYNTCGADAPDNQ